MLRRSFIVVLTMLFVAPAVADTRLRYVDEQSGEEQSAIAIKDSKVRMDDAGSPSWSLFDTETRSLIVVDPDEKTWTSLDEEAMQQAAGQMNAAMAEMREQLEQMPPEQRAMVEKMMGGMADAGRMVETKVDRTGTTLNKAGYDCAQVFMSVGSMARSELCVVAPDELDIPPADRQALDAMQDHMKKFADTMSNAFGAAGSTFDFGFDSVGGIPVYIKQDDQPSAQILEDVSHSGVDADLFRIPQGYREEKIGIGN